MGIHQIAKRVSVDYKQFLDLGMVKEACENEKANDNVYYRMAKEIK
jgi:hypothetical protein